MSLKRSLRSPLRPAALSPLQHALIAGGVTAPPAPGTPAFTITLDNLVGLTGGGTTNVFMTGSTGGGGVVVAKASASRLTGVAPLYVNFDATETTSTLITDADPNVQRARRNQELFYAHDFGDTGAGTWANGVQSSGLTSKNAGYGPVTGHVYETPGTYTYTMAVTDGVNTATRTKTITVQDPNVVYAGALTICISHSGNFAGAPSGATQVNTAGNTDMYAAWNTHKASNKRILFCKADAWVASATIDVNGLSNMLVGGYGTGVAHTFSPGTTLVSLTPNLGIGRTLQGSGGTDIRFCEFRINGSAVNDGVGSTSGTGTQITWSKIEVRGATESFAAYPGSGLNVLYPHDQSCFYECQSTDLYGYAFEDCPLFAGAVAAIGTPGIFTATAHTFNRFNKVRLVGTPPAPLATGTDYFISGTNLTANTFSLSAARWPDVPLAISGVGTCDVTAMTQSGGASAFIAMARGGIMGCYLDNGNKGEQTLRMPYFNTIHVTNNYIARPNQTKNVIKLHPRSYPNTIGVSNGYTEKLVLSGNEIDLRGGYSSGDAIPNNGRLATRVGDCFIVTGYGNGGEGVDERMQNVIVENNVTHSCLGNARDYPSFIAVSCRDFTVRNNIADLSMGDRSSAFTGSYTYTHLHFATVATSTAEKTTGVRIYNNTLYSNLANAESAYFVRCNDHPTYTDADEIYIQNNLWYTPHHPNASKTAYYNQNGACTISLSANNTDNGQTSTTNPNFAVTPPVALADWRPNTGSYAINTGTTVPVLRDFNNASRVGGTYDLGAVLP